jgi:hypothetical protein
VTQPSFSSPPYLTESTAPAFEAVEFFSGVNPARVHSRRRLMRRSGQRNVVDLLLNEAPASQAQEHAWPDDMLAAPTFRPRPKKEFSNHVAVRTLKLGVGAGLLAVLGCQSLIKGWNQSEIWVKNAVKSVVFSILTLYLFASSISLGLGMLQVHHQAPVVNGLYESHRLKNVALKTDIKRIESGQDAEALARGYLDMVKAGEVLLKIQRP